jgi:hypothetical protein
VAAIAGVAAVAVFYVARQIVDEPLEGFGWGHWFEEAHRPAYVAAVLLGVDVAIGLLTDRAARRRDRPLLSRE